MNIGFIGAGRIANTLASTMARMEDVNLYAVAARDLDRAQAFAAQYGFDKAYGSYAEMLRDPNVELVYIATPHSHHFEHMKLCIESGKNVLCEKAFTLNAAQARQIAALAKAKGVYVAEAIWTRYMPSRAMINEVLASGIIGNISTLTCNLSYPVTYKERIVQPELAGGALLEDIRLFDVFRGKQLGEGKKSVAFNLVLRADDRSLTGEEADADVKSILEVLAADCGAIIRA